MSSLAATQADGYYVPPEYFDSGQYKKKSKNQFAGSKGHNQYLQKGVVRFELPYKGICEKCKASVGRGTRYNAQKVKTDDSYFTTPIWEFQMSCRNCQCPWKIRTNPQQRGFDYFEGVSIQAGQDEVVDMASSTIVASGDEIVASSALDRLESVARGERKFKTEIEELQALQELQSQTTLEDASLNAVIRSSFRTDRKVKRLKKQQASKAGWRDGMEWLNPSLEDEVSAKAAVYGKAHSNELRRFGNVRKSSIFSTPKKRKRQSSTTFSLVPPDHVSSGSHVRDDSGKPVTSSAMESQSTQDAPRMTQRIKMSANGVVAKSQSSQSRTKDDKNKNKNESSENGIQSLLADYGSSSDSDDAS